MLWGFNFRGSDADNLERVDPVPWHPENGWIPDDHSAVYEWPAQLAVGSGIWVSGNDTTPGIPRAVKLIQTARDNPALMPILPTILVGRDRFLGLGKRAP